MARRPALKHSIPGLWRIFRRLWPWIRLERRLIITSALALLIGAALRLAEPWPLKVVLDRVLPSDSSAGSDVLGSLNELSSTTVLALAAAAVVLISVLRAFADYQRSVGFARISNRVLRRVRSHVYEHVQTLSLIARPDAVADVSREREAAISSSASRATSACSAASSPPRCCRCSPTSSSSWQWQSSCC